MSVMPVTSSCIAALRAFLSATPRVSGGYMDALRWLCERVVASAVVCANVVGLILALFYFGVVAV